MVDRTGTFLKMMMPVFPGAPWVPKFSGAGGDLSYGDWKEQIQGLLEAQEMTEAKKVKILLGALGGDANRYSVCWRSPRACP